MPNLSKTNSHWRFSFRVLLPIALVFIATIITVGSFMMWTASRNDQTSIARQLILVENSLNEQKQLIAREQKSVVAWEKTLKAVQGDVDLKWIEENLGPSMFEFFGHDRSYVLDPDLKPIYAMAYGKTIKNRTYESARPQIDPIAKRLREISWQGALSSYIYGHNDNIPNIVDVATIDGKPAIISLMPIASNIRVGNQAPGLEYLHISIEFLDDAIALEIYDLLLLKGGHFNNNYAAPDGEVSFAVHSNSGVLVTNFLWQPSRPGSQMFADTGPAIILAILIAIVIISLLVFRLRRSTATLEAERSAAHHLAYHDKLTGLGNRAMFEKCLEEAIPQAIPGKAELALLILDLDMFKQVNDTLGHQAGDELIREVAKRLHPLVRGTDVITRLGGDEFAIIATGFSCTKDINTMCNRMVKSIREPFNLEAGQAFVGVSIGVSVSADNSDDGEELIRKADIALYEAKNGGRNQFKLFEKQMGETVQKRQKIETDLRNALNSNDQISVEFDPLVRKDGVEILGFEAKIVWEHPLLGIIAPSTFIPVAEYCGLINTVGNLLLKQACEKGAQNPGRFIAVRAFSTSLRNLDYADTVFNIIKETGIAPSDLELEINENMLSDDEAIAANNLRSFRAAGIRIAINDFGSGFTSLRLAQEFQIDRIKISRSFIAEMEQSPDPEAITHAIVWLARAIGVEVSADGVDSVAQKDFLFRMGCMSFQGKVFSSKSQEKWLEIAAKQTSEKTIKCDYEEDEIEVWG